MENQLGLPAAMDMSTQDFNEAYLAEFGVNEPSSTFEDISCDAEQLDAPKCKKAKRVLNFEGMFPQAGTEGAVTS